MAQRATKSLVTPWLLTVGMTVCLILLLAVAYVRHLGWISDEVVGQMASLSEEEALAKLRRTAELGDRGLPILVAALGSHSEHLVHAARQILLDEIDRWELLSGDATASKMTGLAKVLAGRVEQFDDRGRRAASDLASRILLWPGYGAEDDRGELVSLCAQVLRTRQSNQLPQPRIAVTQAAAETALVAEENVSSQGPSTPPLEAKLSLDQLEAVPGGGLPVDLLRVTESSDANTSSRIASPAGERAQRDAARRPSEPLQNPLRTPGYDPRKRFGSRLAVQTGPPSPSGERERRPLEWPADEKVGPEKRSTAELLRLLHDSDQSTVEGAERQLVAGGFTSAQLNLARRLTDPSATTRLYWARRLPTIQGINAQAWLLWLAEDDDADVRLTAITLLATSGDPEVKRRIAYLAQRDRDERIRRQAERILAGQGR